MEPEATILAVDPVESQRTFLRDLLERDGFSVQTTAAVDAALGDAHRVRPHLIVLGRNLSESETTGFCRALRAEPAISGTPVLIMSQTGSDAAVVAELNAGADDYVLSDSAPELILSRVRRLIHYHKMAGLAMLDRQLVQVGRLLAGIVHEIRGPLSVIRGSAELLKLNVEGRSEDLQWVDSILRGASLLQLRLEHLMGAVRSGQTTLQPIDVGALATETLDLFVRGLPPDHRQVTVRTDCVGALPILGDAGRLMQVLFDLLTNAYQAILSTGRPGEIVLRTRRTTVDGQAWVKIDVIDDGPGVPDVHLRRIFEPFFTTRHNGSGYGLYLASSIVRDLGGQLVAANNSEGGACFSVMLPIDSATDAGAILETAD